MTTVKELIVIQLKELIRQCEALEYERSLILEMQDCLKRIEYHEDKLCECDANKHEACAECCDHEFDDSEGNYCINGCDLHYTDVM